MKALDERQVQRNLLLRHFGSESVCSTLGDKLELVNEGRDVRVVLNFALCHKAAFVF